MSSVSKMLKTVHFRQQMENSAKKLTIKNFSLEKICRKNSKSNRKCSTIARLAFSKNFPNWERGKNRTQDSFERNWIRTRMIVVTERTWPSSLTMKTKSTSASEVHPIAHLLKDARKRASTLVCWRCFADHVTRCKFWIG